MALLDSVGIALWLQKDAPVALVCMTLWLQYGTMYEACFAMVFTAIIVMQLAALAVEPTGYGSQMGLR